MRSGPAISRRLAHLLVATLLLLTNALALAEAPEQVKPLDLTSEESAWLKAHPEVRVGVNHGWAPVEFLHESGSFRGISLDFLDRLEKILPVQFVRDRKMEGMNSPKFDMLSAVPSSRNMHEAGFIIMQQPYLKMPFAVFTREDNQDIHGIDDLKGKHVAVFKNGPVARQLEQDYPEIRLYKADIAEEALEALVNGRVDAYIGNLVVVSYVARNQGYGNIKLAGETPFNAYAHMAVRSDWPELASILQKGLDRISQEERDKISRNWMSVTYDYRVNYPLIFSIAGAGLFIIVSFALWNIRLNREIKLRKQMETDLIREKDRAEIASVAKSQFLANMSHEIRTPMNGILGMSQLLLDRQLSERDRHDYSETIHHSAKNLLAILNDILDISKIEAGRLEIVLQPFVPGRIVDEVFSLFQGAARDKQITLKLEKQGLLGEACTGDPVRIRQVLGNLLSNAIKFTERGSVTLRTRLDDNPGQPGQRLLSIEVEDTGIGIGAADQQRLFKAFSQSDSSITRRFGGTGLGLYISKQLCELMHGEIGFESTPGQGSTFRIRIPLGNQPGRIAQADPVANLAGHPRHPQACNILVAEDNPVNAKVIARFLDRLGYRFEIVGDGLQALRKLESGRYDLVLMDYHMPVMDGAAAVALLRQREMQTGAPRIPVIAVTAAAHAAEIAKCMEAGMDDFIVKPIEMTPFAEVLEKWKHSNAQRVQDADEVPALLKAEPAPEAVAPARQVLNYEGLLGWLDHNEAATLDLLQTALETMQDSRQSLQQTPADDKENLYRICHRIKGTAMTVLAERVQDAAIGAEALLRDPAADALELSQRIAQLTLDIDAFILDAGNRLK